jgi:hypothetical protein
MLYLHRRGEKEKRKTKRTLTVSKGCPTKTPAAPEEKNERAIIDRIA